MGVSSKRRIFSTNQYLVLHSAVHETRSGLTLFCLQKVFCGFSFPPIRNISLIQPLGGRLITISRLLRAFFRLDVSWASREGLTGLASTSGQMVPSFGGRTTTSGAMDCRCGVGAGLDKPTGRRAVRSTEGLASAGGMAAGKGGKNLVSAI
jgi:hypothetical protein